MKTAIVCLLHGKVYDPIYVDRLASMVARNTTREYDFYCYTDQPIRNHNTITITDPDQFEPVWFKLALLANEQLASYERKIFLDLDVVIQSSIDWLWDVNPSRLHVLASLWKPRNGISDHREKDTLFNSSVMVWRNSSRIFEEFMKASDRHMMTYKGIDRFLWHENQDVGILPMDKVYSYREGATLSDNEPLVYRPSYSICIYNQQPKPHTCVQAEPAKSCWK